MAFHGSDVYRLNCRGCHAESGHGAPPEINSVIDPVRATSVEVIMARMKKAGMNMSRANATLLAKQSNTALLDRFHKGGQDMPPFPQLSEPEIRVSACLSETASGRAGSRKATSCGQRVAIPGRRANRQVHVPHLPQRDRAESQSPANSGRGDTSAEHSHHANEPA